MEKWATIDEYGFYSVSSHGRVRSNERSFDRNGHRVHIRSRILKPAKDHKGYLRVALSLDRKLITHKVHRLVAVAFCPHGSIDKNQVNHIDGNKTNNNSDNLEWVTPRENIKHAFETSLYVPKMGHRHHRSKTTLADRKLMYEMKCMGRKNEDIANHFGISVSCVKRTIKHEINTKAD